MPKTTLLSIDQSYTRLGYCVQTKRDVLEIASIDLRKLKNPTQKRNCVRELTQILIRKYNPTAVIVERVRIYAGGYISFKTAAMLASMTATIVDAAYIHTEFRKITPVFSVDTQAWKKAVLGRTTASKAETVTYVGERLPPEITVSLDHHGSDAYCIGRYLWETDEPKLVKER